MFLLELLLMVHSKLMLLLWWSCKTDLGLHKDVMLFISSLKMESRGWGIWSLSVNIDVMADFFLYRKNVVDQEILSSM